MRHKKDRTCFHRSGGADPVPSFKESGDRLVCRQRNFGLPEYSIAVRGTLIASINRNTEASST
jgi:hypothetical protein